MLYQVKNELLFCYLINDKLTLIKLIELYKFGFHKKTLNFSAEGCIIT